MFNPKTVPVHGIRKFRGGGHCFRRPRTASEKRLSQPLHDEPRARPPRGANNLPTSWDDLVICRQRSWKAQGKRLKAWRSR